MLHNVRADDDVTHAQLRGQRPGDTRIDDELRFVNKRHCLRAYGGVDFAHAGAGKDNVRAQQPAADKGHAADLAAHRGFHLRDQAFDLNVQSADDPDHLKHILSQAKRPPGRRYPLPCPRSPCVRWWWL